MKCLEEKYPVVRNHQCFLQQLANHRWHLAVNKYNMESQDLTLVVIFKFTRSVQITSHLKTIIKAYPTRIEKQTRKHQYLLNCQKKIKAK